MPFLVPLIAHAMCLQATWHGAMGKTAWAIIAHAVFSSHKLPIAHAMCLQATWHGAMGKIGMTNHESCLLFLVHMASHAHKAMPPFFQEFRLNETLTRLGEDKKVIKPKASRVGLTCAIRHRQN